MIGSLVAPKPSNAGTIRVPEDAPSVLTAVDLAASGDTVLVGPGTWTDTATRTVVAPNGSFVVKACAFPQAGVLIRGQGAGVTILDVGGSTGPLASAVAFMAAAGSGPLRVESLTLTGARGPQGGQAVIGTFADGLEIRSCRFEGNEQYFGGAAVGVLWCPLTMEDCQVIRNTSEIGVIRVDLTPVQMTRCRFEENIGRCVTTIYDPGDGPAIFRDCQFVRNRGPDFGVALNLQSAGSFLIDGCLFLQNVAESGTGGAVRVAGSAGEICRSVFAFDSCYTAGSRGAGIRMEYSQGAVHNNTFAGCYSGLSGAAFSAFESTVSAFRANVVAYSSRGAGVDGTSTTIALNDCNLYWGNTANFGNWTPSASDVFADPLFCDFPMQDFAVRNDSPCLFPPTPSCAPIGALGVGCGGVAIEPISFGRVKSMFRE